MAQRIKPYTTNQVSWNTILTKHLQIPMNQREYSWTNEELIKFLDDLFQVFEEGKYIEKMGSIINLIRGIINYIYDGQQRILTIILILIVMSNLEPRLKNAIERLLTLDTNLDTLTEEQKKLKEQYDITKIPKIHCINPQDMEGLAYIYNNKFDSWMKYDESNKKYTFNGLKTDSKLYSAYIFIYNYFISKDCKEKLIELYKFILNDIDIQYYDCTDSDYVAKIFDWENNRGMKLEILDIIKNPIIVKIPDCKKLEVYNKWEELKSKFHNAHKTGYGYGQRIFDIAISLYNKEIVRTIKHEDLFKPIINNEDTYKELNKFFEIVETLFKIMDKIGDDKFGRLIHTKSKFCLTWEAYMWCLLPIFYTTKTIDSRLIKLFTTWYFRNLQFKNRTFNNLGYSEEFIKITNKVIKNSNYDYYKEINTCLVNNKNLNINDESYIQALQNMTFTPTNATSLLLFYETCINTDIHQVPLEYTLEHIHCQSKKDKLKNETLINNIGNLTLIEGKNSKNGHKGNSSLGCKEYIKKKSSYQNSSAQISRNLAKEYETFEEKDIISRSIQIISELNKYTNY